VRLVLNKRDYIALLRGCQHLFETFFLFSEKTGKWTEKGKKETPYFCKVFFLVR